MKKRLALLLAACLLLLPACSGAGSASSVNRLTSEVEAGNYANAAEIYSSSIYGNTEREYQSKQMLQEMIAEAVNEYNGGSISYDQASNTITTIDRTGILSIESVDDGKAELDALRSSKAAFDSAESLFASGLYGEALENYLLVSERDTNYAAAQQKAEEAKGYLLDSMSVELDGYLAENDYDSALTLIQKTRPLLPNEPTLDAKETEVEAKYLNWALAQAEDAFANEGYEQAIRVITNAQNNLGDNERLTAALEEYQSYIPVWLNDLEYFDTDSDWGNQQLHNYSDETDNFGNTYKHALNIYSELTALRAGDWTSVRYYLGGAYSTFSGTCITPYDDRDNDVSGYLEIYGDDVLLYKSPTMVSDSTPEPFSVDISGVTFLRIVFWPPVTYANGSTPTLCDGLLQK